MSTALIRVAAAVAAWYVLGGGLVGAEEAKSAASGTATAPGASTGPDVRGFRAFCDEWMGKLRERERYNTAHITWEKQGGQVAGEYVGYSQDCTCNAREESGKDPIGKIIYRELRYHRQGGTPTEALAGAGTIVEQTEVTEIFRYGKGRWQY